MLSLVASSLPRNPWSSRYYKYKALIVPGLFYETVVGSLELGTLHLLDPLLFLPLIYSDLLLQGLHIVLQLNLLLFLYILFLFDLVLDRLRSLCLLYVLLFPELSLTHLLVFLLRLHIYLLFLRTDQIISLFTHRLVHQSGLFSLLIHLLHGQKGLFTLLRMSLQQFFFLLLGVLLVFLQDLVLVGLFELETLEVVLVQQVESVLSLVVLGLFGQNTVLHCDVLFFLDELLEVLLLDVVDLLSLAGFLQGLLFLG